MDEMCKDSLAPEILQMEVFFLSSTHFQKKDQREQMRWELTSGEHLVPIPFKQTAGAGFPGPGPVKLSVSPRMETAQTSLGNLFLCTTSLEV